jgi:ribosomal protein S18 acetylase RimI-like enzyme
MSVSVSQIKDPSEIDVLRGKEAKFANLHYKYDSDTIALLKNNFLLPKSHYLIAKDGNEFAGFCSIDPDWWEPDFFFLREIFISENYQRQGLGEVLMRECIEHAKESGAVGVVTETAFENTPMQKLSEKCGFKQWDNPQWKDGVTYKLIF